MEQSEKKNDSEYRRRLGPAINFGTTFAGGMAVFAWIGYKLDQRFGLDRVCTLGGILLGLLFGAYELWKAIKIISTENEP